MNTHVLKLFPLMLTGFLFCHHGIAGGQNAPTYGHGVHAKSTSLFTGFSINGAIGGIKGDSQIDHSALAVLTGPDAIGGFFSFMENPEITKTGVAGWLGLEYDYQFSNQVLIGLAVTAGLEDLELKNTVSDEQVSVLELLADLKSTQHISSTFKTTLENDFAVLFKMGYVVRNNTLLYAQIGPRWGNFDSKLSGAASINGFITGGEPTWSGSTETSKHHSQYYIGVTAGVGIQQALSDHFRLGLEYMYSRYNDLDVMLTAASVEDDTAAISTLVREYDVITNSVMATLSYKF